MLHNEQDAVTGDVIETPNGNRYVVLPNGKLAYLGNRILDRSEGLIERTGAPCKILGRMPLLPYVPTDEAEFDDIESDWDMLRRRERIPMPLPKGCSCGHDALAAVLSCKVHTVEFGEPEPDAPAVFENVLSVRFLRGVSIGNSSLRYETGNVLHRQPSGTWPGDLMNTQVQAMLRLGWVEKVDEAANVTFAQINPVPATSFIGRFLPQEATTLPVAVPPPARFIDLPALPITSDIPDRREVLRVQFMRTTWVEDVLYPIGRILRRDADGPWPHPLRHQQIRMLLNAGWVEDIGTLTNEEDDDDFSRLD